MLRKQVKVLATFLLCSAQCFTYARSTQVDIQKLFDSARAGGTVYLPQEIELTSSLTINKPLTLLPEAGSTTIYGSKAVSSTSLSQDDPNYLRLDPADRSTVRVVDLAKEKVDLSRVSFPSTMNGVGSPVGLPELVEDDNVLSLTRFPFRGFLICGQTTGTTNFISKSELPSWSVENQTGRNHYMVQGYFTAQEYFEEQLPAEISSNRKGVRLITTDSVHSYQPLQPNSRFAVLNILEELRNPGQYYIDYELQRIYFIPINRNFVTLRVSTVSGPILNIGPNASGTTISGKISLRDGRGDGLHCADGLSNVSIDGLSVKNVFGTGILFLNAKLSSISRVSVANTGSSGISISGGDNSTLQASGITLSDFALDNTCRIFRTYAAALNVNGVGHIIKDGTITNVPNQAILYYGNNLDFEGITIDGAAQEAGDVGAIYTGCSMIQWGNTLQGIVLKNIPGPLLTSKQNSCGYRYGIYLDDQMSGTSVFGVSGENTNCLVYLGGGVYNQVANVYASNCTESPVQLDDRGQNWEKDCWHDMFSVQWLWAQLQPTNAYYEYGNVFNSLEGIEVVYGGAPVFCSIQNVQLYNSPKVNQIDYSHYFRSSLGFDVYVMQN